MLNWKRAAILSLIPIMLVGCKIEVVAPFTGSVTTKDGSFSCSAGEKCVVDVVDVFFDQTYIPIPLDEYDFIRWQEGHKLLCGRAKTPCHLFTSGFSENEDLLGVLETDQTFYLRPVFRKKTHKTKAGNSSMCTDYNLAKGEGNKNLLTVTRNYAVGSQHTSETELVMHYEGRVGIYNGKKVYSAYGEFTITQYDESGVPYYKLNRYSRYYYDVDSGKQQSMNIGLVHYDEPHETVSHPVELTMIHSPLIWEPNNLNMHESVLLERGILTAQGEPPAKTTTERLTFQGKEAISTPGGTFNTCRYLHESLNAKGQVISESTRWAAPDSNATVRHELSNGNYGELLDTKYIPKN